MRNLERKLHEWVQEGLIEQSQVEPIRLYEESTGRANWALYGIAGIGVVALVAGIISIVAANWIYISRSEKLLSYFILECGIALLFLRYSTGSSLLREVLLTLCSLLVLGGIGLIGQVFNLESDGWSGLLMWVVLTLPMLWLAHSQLMNHLWIAGLVATIFSWCAAHERLMRDFWGAAYFLSIGLVYLLFALSIIKDRFCLPPGLCRALRQWTTLVIVCVFAPYANMIWAAGSSDFWEVSPYMAEAQIVADLMLGFALLAILWAKPKLSGKLRWSLYALCVSSFLAVTLPIITHPVNQDLLGCFWFLLIWSSASAAAAFSGRRGLFNFASFVIAARFVVVYFEVFGSLAATGIGLILSGLVIIGIALFWNHYRKRVALLIVEGIK